MYDLRPHRYILYHCEAICYYAYKIITKNRMGLIKSSNFFESSKFFKIWNINTIKWLISFIQAIKQNMHKVIEVILLLALLLGCSCVNYGWLNGVECHYSCDTCWYGGDPTLCTSCGGNRYSVSTGWWYYQCPCPSGYYDNGNTWCPQCSYQCSTCSSDPSSPDPNNCLTCNGAYRGSPPSCSCPSNYYDNGTPNCQPCHYSCTTCSSSWSCNSCNSGYNRYYVSGSYCACAARYYDPGSIGCLPCDPTCLSCYGTASNNCLTCNSAAYRVQSSTSCVCSTGYYAISWSVEQCAACLYSCLTCSSTSTKCTSCNSGLNRGLVSNSCPCNAGYFQNSSLLCQPCSYQCATCVNSASNCLTCNPNRLSAPTCACQPYYYDDGSSAACIRCQYSCSSCSSLTNCDTCNSSYMRLFTQVSPFCVCPDRYYDPGSQPCASCDPTCFRCSNSLSSGCTSCNLTAYRVLSSGSCVCMTGYYATSSTVELCSACLYSCLTCSVSANNCTSCDSILNRVLNSNTCPCAPTYFQNSSLLCDTCHSSCQTCTSKLSCVTCFSSQQTIINSTGFCSCAAGKFWNTNVCATCSYFCLTCVGSASNCTSCPANSNRVFSTGNCNCIDGYYNNNTVICLACSYTCQKCSSGATNGCTSCDSSKKRTLTNGSCLCASKYFEDGSNSACQPCNYKCLTCTAANACLTCNTSLHRSNSSATGFCQCNSNYYESNNNCYACMSTCLTCSNGITCLTCDSTLNRFLNTTTYTCDCIAGYYQNSSGLCALCNSLCATCNSASTCLTCKGNLNRTFNSNTSSCDCLAGYVLIVSSNLCQSCQAICLACVTNYTNRCLSCDSSTSRTLNSTNYQCQCPVGYFDDGVNTKCKTCSYTCLTCSGNSNACTSCPSNSNRVYNSVAFTCYCAQHYYDNNVTFTQNSTCLACSYYCSTCMQSISCLSCNASNQRTINPVNSKCICMTGYYDDGSHQLCATCSYKCLTCTNASACLACNSTWKRDTPSSMCPCSTGYYDNSTAICLACHYSCKTCTTGTKCSTCEGLYNRLINSTTKYCSCTAGYYDPGTPICQLCSYSCLTCVTTGSYCLSCNATAQRTLNNVSNNCPCNNGYYDNAATLCLPCNYTCSTCGNNRSCLTCNITRFRTINSISGLCVCITGYYDNNSTQTCLACQATCLTCINSTNCTSCDATRNRVLNRTADYANSSDPFCPCFYKYYSLGTNSSCNPCHFSCSYCSGPTNTSCLYCNAASQRKLASGQCKCINGFYDTNLTQACPSCNIACLTCWNNFTTTCFTCNTTNFMMVGANTCYVNCPTYYFNNVTAMICQLCQTHCLVCINSTNCSQCESPVFLFNFTCLAKCLVTYYPNSTTHKCEPCKSGCANCSTSYNCFKCVNSSYYVDQATTLCELCSTACLTCFGPTQSNCLNCKQPLYLNSQYMCVNLTCSYGKYVDTFQGCVQCNIKFPHSLNCNNSVAFLCEDSYLLENGSCVECNKVTGYQLDSFNECNEICGDGIVIYYQCDDGNSLNGDGCSANCIIQSGWNCSLVNKKSVCKLSGSVEISLKKVIKFARINKIRMVLKLSLPLQLSDRNFKVNFSNLDALYYSYDVTQQDQTKLTEVSVDVSYEKDIQGQQLQLTYSQSRRLQELTFSEPRLLTSSVTFSSTLNISSFPPANYITQNTYSYYDIMGSIIYYLSIVITVLNFIVVPKKYALHSISFSWIVPYIYFTLFYSTSYSTEWVSSITKNLKLPSIYMGFSIGQCCLNDDIQATTSQIFHNVGGILVALILAWAIYCIVNVISCQKQSESLFNISRTLKYFLLTFHLIFLMQFTYASTFGLFNYILENRIDSINITLGLFLLVGVTFFVISLQYITYISKFDGGNNQKTSKAATRQTIQKQQSNDTEQNDSNIVINLTNVKEISRAEQAQFNNTGTAYVSSVHLKKNGTQTAGFVQSSQKTEQSQDESQQQQEMGQVQSFFPYDYCYLYNNANKKAKYFLPLLMAKVFLYALFGVTLVSYPFGMMMLHLMISAIFLGYLCFFKPFQSKFTTSRVIIIQVLVIIIEVMFATFQFYAQKLQYIYMMEYYLVLLITILLSVTVIFIIVEQYKIWKTSIQNICESCCLSWRLRGKSQKIDLKQKQANDQNIIRVETVNQSQIGEVDAFYARMLQKQALNRLYKRERMIHDSSHFEKDFI